VTCRTVMCQGCSHPSNISGTLGDISDLSDGDVLRVSSSEKCIGDFS